MGVYVRPSGVGGALIGAVLNINASSPASYPGSGTSVYDLSGNNNDGTLNNGVFFNSEGIKSSFGFDGSDDEIHLPNNGTLNFSGSQQYTAFSAIYPIGGGTTWHGIFSKGNSQQYALTLNRPNAYLHYETNQGGYGALNTNSGIVPFNTWSLVAVRFDGSLKTIWLNGVIVASQSAPALNSSNNTEEFRIGEGNNGENFRGNIGMTQVYNRALSDREMNLIYTIFRPRFNLS